MTDREKVIKGLEDSFANQGCGYMDGVGELYAVSGEDLQNAIALLKEQESVVPINSYGTFRCGNCRNIVGYNDSHGRGYQNNFCSKCGKAVEMTDRKTVMSWLEGLTQDDWPEWHSDSEVQETAKAALELLKEQETVEPKQVGLCGKEDWYGLVYTCPYCNAAWMGDRTDTHFCPECGKAVRLK